MDVVIIEPDEGMTKEIGRQLLELADNPGDVQWATWPVTGFKVPVELANRLKQARALPSEQPASAEPVRRRGRPRKQAEAPVQDTDDTEKEE